MLPLINIFAINISYLRDSFGIAGLYLFYKHCIPKGCFKIFGFSFFYKHCILTGFDFFCMLTLINILLIIYQPRRGDMFIKRTNQKRFLAPMGRHIIGIEP